MLVVLDRRRFYQSREALSYAGGVGAEKEAQGVLLGQVHCKCNVSRMCETTACGVIRPVKVEDGSLAVIGSQ